MKLRVLSLFPGPWASWIRHRSAGEQHGDRPAPLGGL